MLALFLDASGLERYRHVREHLVSEYGVDILELFSTHRELDEAVPHGSVLLSFLGLGFGPACAFPVGFLGLEAGSLVFPPLLIP